MEKSKGLKIALIILGLLVVLLGAYFVYDKFIKEDEVIKEETTDKQNEDNKSSYKELDITEDGLVNELMWIINDNDFDEGYSSLEIYKINKSKITVNDINNSNLLRKAIYYIIKKYDGQAPYIKCSEKEKFNELFNGKNAWRSGDYVGDVFICASELTPEEKQYEGSNITDENRLYMREPTGIGPERIKYVTNSELQSTIKKIYGEDVNYTLEKKLNNWPYSCVLVDEKDYYCIDEYYGSTFTPVYHLTEKAVDYEEYIEIYESYSDLSGEEVSKTNALDSIIDLSLDTDSNIQEIFDILKKDYPEFVKEYKHTFKKAEDGTYYWFSSEVIN